MIGNMIGYVIFHMTSSGLGSTTIWRKRAFSFRKWAFSGDVLCHIFPQHFSEAEIGAFGSHFSAISIEMVLQIQENERDLTHVALDAPVLARHKMASELGPLQDAAEFGVGAEGGTIGTSGFMGASLCHGDFLPTSRETAGYTYGVDYFLHC